ncbi:hypothetical protein [Haloarcula halophila]|uniref:hypothetical protein n=1 Tax=Haloarcula TaxID=2237 RepID=UPI0023E3B54B|nr:hypothetical protein [Halomicroarcula sp. DFY41]
MTPSAVVEAESARVFDTALTPWHAPVNGRFGEAVVLDVTGATGVVRCPLLRGADTAYVSE